MNNIARNNYLEISKAFLIQLVIFFVGTFAGLFLIPDGVKSILSICFFALIIFSLFFNKTGFFRSKTSVNLYALFLGILSGSAYIYYFYQLGAGAFLFAVLCVIAIFFVAYLTAKNSNDETIFNLQKILMPGFIFLIIAEALMYFFFQYSMYVIIISAIGILIYSIATIVAMKNLQSRVSYAPLSDEEIYSYSFNLFINVLYLLLDILRLLSIISDND